MLQHCWNCLLSTLEAVYIGQDKQNADSSVDVTVNVVSVGSLFV